MPGPADEHEIKPGNIVDEDGIWYMNYEDYINFSDSWRRKRNECLMRDNFTCVKCGSKRNLEAHHLNYTRIGHENVNTDLITLCHSCHQKLENEKKKKDKEDFERIEQIIESNNQLLEKTRRQRKRDLFIIDEFIKIVETDDYSNIGKGKKDYCNRDIVKADFEEFLKKRGIDHLNIGYCTRVIDYFRDKRYRIINDFIEKGYPPYEIKKRTNFSWKMINKAYYHPDIVKSILKEDR